MKKYIIVITLLFTFSSCLDLEIGNDPLCVPVICGELRDDQVNFTIFNSSGVDYDEFIFSVGGRTDTVTLFPLQQFSCWFNYDTLHTSYFVAQGVSDNTYYTSDTLWYDEGPNYFTSGVFVLEVYQNVATETLEFDVIEDYTGECKDI